MTQAQAGPTIKQYINSHTKSSAYFNCSYKGKKASKKCLVSHSSIRARAHPGLKNFYGADYSENIGVINIKWPDGDISRYAYVDSMDMVNLNDKDGWGYRLRDKDDENGWDIDFSRGFFIDTKPSNKDHIRLW